MILKYFLAWFGMMVIAILNGGIRDSVYKDYVGELSAHQISTVTLLIFFAIYIWFLTKRWQLKSSRSAMKIGVMWFIMTLIFEFGMGRFIQNQPWENLFYTYNIFAGQVWLFIPLFVFVAPILFYKFSKKEGDHK